MPDRVHVPVSHTFAWLCCYAVSGFCLLTLEMLWMREVALRAGNTVVAATLVFAVFFLSAALGNLAGAWWCRRNAAPWRAYGICEFAAGATALAAFLLARGWWQQHDAGLSASTLSFVITALLVAVPSCCSGAALPLLMERFVPSLDQRANLGGRFYGVNLLGAATGVALGGVLFPWWLGLAGAFQVVTLLQMAQGFIAWRLGQRVASLPPLEEAKTTSTASANTWGWLLPTLSGLLSLAAQGFLMLWARQILSGSIYSISAVLAAFLTGLGLGSLAAGCLRRRGMSAPDALILFSGLSALLLFTLPLAAAPLTLRGIEWTATAPATLLGQSLLTIGVVLLPLTLCLGGVLPLAWELAWGQARHEGTIAGTTIALNKFGSALGMVMASFLLVPSFGLSRGLALIACGYAAMAVVLFWQQPRKSRFTGCTLLLLFLFGLGAILRPVTPLGLRPEEQAVDFTSGPYGTVTVVDNLNTRSRHILLNSRQRLSGTQNALSSQQHQGWVPLLFCPKPERALTIGMASGISAAAMLDYPVKELIAVELVPGVVEAAQRHFAPWNGALFTDKRAKVLIGDGRAVLNRLPGKFDAIVCDLFFPDEDGTANLYSRDFFTNARDRLSPQGVFCLWLPCYQHDPETAGMIIRTFSEIFPNALLVRSNLDPMQPVLGLLGSNQPLPISRKYLTARLASPAGQILSARSSYFRNPDLAWLLLAGDLHAAQPDFTAYPPSTDDRPLFLFLGGRPVPPNQQLVGMTFLNWMGRRFVQPSYPSAQLDNTPPEEILRSVRAANYYFAAAVAQSVIPGDRRPEATRIGQTLNYFEQARKLNPAAPLPFENLGR